MAGRAEIRSPDDLDRIRRSRRHPRIWQYDYLHLRALVHGLRASLAGLGHPVRDVLDVWCGSRPYDDLLPDGARCVGFDVEANPYGVADVVSDTFLPFPDASFDLAVCIEAFQYVDDPEHAVSELSRVLRPGGSALVSLVFAFEYDPRLPFEGRYTAQQLRELFAGWDGVRVREDGGRAVSWAVLTNSLVFSAEQRARALRPLCRAAYVVVNALGLALARAEHHDGGASLPMNLTLLARKPLDG